MHEIIVESGEHIASFAELSDEQLRLVMRVYRDRIFEFSKRDHVQHALLFKNSGPTAGASLEHVHSQLIGLPSIPTGISHEVERARRFHTNQGQCNLCNMLDRELSAENRIITQSSNFVAFCPYASRFSHEVWIVPRGHASNFGETSNAQICELAELVQMLGGQIEKIGDRQSFNLLIQTAPFDTSHQDYYHWRMEIFPRLSSIAGFELGSDCYINPTCPENAANRLRIGIS